MEYISKKVAAYGQFVLVILNQGVFINTPCTQHSICNFFFYFKLFVLGKVWGS